MKNAYKYLIPAAIIGFAAATYLSSSKSSSFTNELWYSTGGGSTSMSFGPVPTLNLDTGDKSYGRVPESLVELHIFDQDSDGVFELGDIVSRIDSSTRPATDTQITGLEAQRLMDLGYKTLPSLLKP